MRLFPRIYETALRQHIDNDSQMLFVTGPRQVGKSTLCKTVADTVFNWDIQKNKRLILKGSDAVAGEAGLNIMQEKLPVVALDEIHKFARWKSFLKGFFDEYRDAARIVVTGSSRLDVYKKGGDSLMGRYFLYHVHPFSVAEMVNPSRKDKIIHPPVPIQEKDWKALWEHGGFPEPLAKRDKKFTLRWNKTRKNQLFREDLRDLTRIQEIGQIEVMAEILETRSGDSLKYSTLANEVRVSENTIRKWIATLNSLYFGFTIKPWHKNVKNALTKEPKWYKRDWSQISDTGKKAETFVACHLLKAVEWWNDCGYGEFDLYYIRNKQKQEVDFLVTQNKSPWFLAEVKLADKNISPVLSLMQEQTGAKHAFQIVVEMDYVNSDCFKKTKPTVVPAKTFLSQLV